MSTSAVAFNAQVYRRALGKALPRVIENDADLEQMTQVLMDLDELIEADKATHEQEMLAEMLTVLIQKYEEEHYPAIEAPPHKRLAALLEDRGLGQKDLAALLESRPAASAILSGKRQISKSQVKLLAEYLSVPADLFL
ncbi:MAG TPA: helix-turn-helix domain-containing protein [Bryobacteraceae bacterium]|jgi:HTH-type transcriptional regulator/antitoxin HigA|nr:helix-turn-helix domain-containing protein [Bryobacteraceae bacterium]